MDIYHLSPEGLHESEKAALNQIEKALPKTWYAFSSLEMFDRREGNFETDLIVLTHDRIIVVELKRWSGKIFSKNNKWVLDWGSHQEKRKHPLKQVRRASQILNAKIEKKLRGKVFSPWIDHCVVMCGSADITSLPDDERDFVFFTEEFINICTKRYSKHYPTLFGRYAIGKESDQPNKSYKVWKTFFANNSVDFKPKTYSVNNYAQISKPLFSHQDKIYSEFLAQKVDDSNYKALMRKWDFWAPSIAEKAQTPEERSLIGYRESKVLGYIDNQDESLENVHLELNYIPPKEDISSDFVELYKWPGNRLRLDDFMARQGAKLTDEGRIDIVKVLVSHLARLHEIDVAHRDIGKHSIWLSLPSKVTFSNFLTASYPDPDRQSVRTVRDILKSGRVEIPEDLYEDKAGTPFTRDVYLAGAAAHYIIYGHWPKKLDDGTYGWANPQKTFKDGLLDSWLETCLDLEAANRFANMSAALDELNRRLETAGSNSLDVSELEQFYSDTNVYMAYMPAPIKQKSATSLLLRSQDEETGICLWHGVSQFNTDKTLNMELATFLERINSLKNSSLQCLLNIREFGFNPSMQSLFVAYEWVKGETWNEWLAELTDSDLAKTRCEMLLKALVSLHRSQFIHGDIHPQNIVVRETDIEPVFIDMFEYESEGITKQPYNTNYLPNNYDQISHAARDRYAVVKMIEEVASQFSLIHLKQYCSELMNLVEISEGEIFRFVDDFEEIIAPKPIKQLTSFPVSTRYLPDFSNLESDDGKYYISVKVDDRSDDLLLKFFISGVRQKIDLYIDPENKVIKKMYSRESITHHQFISNKRSADFELEGTISLVDGPALTADELIKDLFKSDVVKQKLEQIPSNNKEANTKVLSKQQTLSLKDVAQKVSSRKIWQALVETEDEVLPKVSIARPPELLNKNEVIVRFIKGNQGVDFDLTQERVHVKHDKGTKVIPIGRLLEIGRDTLRIGNVKKVSFGVGDQLKLESSLAAASLAKRQKAVENILKNRAVIPDLVDYFDINENIEAHELADEPTDEELDVYNVYGEDGTLEFSLNPQQRSAFKKLYRFGPVSLLQGPPGTGKTSFISSFIHFAASKGASKILLVSQSHEAVNNAAEKVRKLFSTQNKEVTVVRLGDEPNVSSPLLDVHEISLQDHYREMFRAEFKQRLKGVVTPLALPDEFVDLAIEFESSFGMKISSVTRGLVNSDSKTVDVLSDRQKTLHSKFNQWAQRKGLNLTLYTGSASTDTRNLFYDEISSLYEVTSSDSVSRFQQIVELSKEWLEVMSSRNAHFQNFLTKTRTLVCGTCVGIARNHYGINENIYDWVIIDEAARSSASEMAIAMQIGKRVLLVGDHKQLPPSYEEEHLLAAHRKLPQVKVEDLEQSDFERSFYSSYGKKIGQSLLTQYRMVKPIGDLVSQCFYEGLLETGRESECKDLEFEGESFDKAVTWIDTSSEGENSLEKKPNYTNANKHSVINEFEVEVIIRLIQKLTSNSNIEPRFENGPQEDSPIGVICMYAEQQKQMIRKINGLSWARTLLEKRLLKIDTVDSYQGKENDIIILSLVRNNKRFLEGFVSSENRANVALSRAKEKLFIVGASHMWSERNNKSAFGRVLKHIKENSDCLLIEANSLNKEG
ncbi:AAA domain-containing protein [Teredinibacter turnerae]|uniref:AAA domain-containing protein n=1 Tax=Teredinibacter turnerae TaxID=2426 RepID=UPI000378B280|nr:AAA domain-containing protein [Teredinibacter turnerae]